MKILKTNIQDHYVIFETEFTADEIQKVETGILNNYARTLKVEGFRQGKAPIQIVKKYVPAEELKYRVMNLLTSKNIVKIENSEENKNIDVVVSGEWTYEIVKFDSNKQAIVNIKFEQYPDVKVGDYKKIEIPEFDSEITKEYFDEELEFLLKSVAKDVKFNDDEKVANGDLVSINLTLKAENEKEHELKQRVFEVKENKSIIDFENHVIGSKVKDKINYEVTYPNDYFIKEFADKKGQVEIEILNAYHVVVPELNEEFISTLGLENVKTKQQFLDQFKKDLIQKKLNSYKAQHIDKIYEELLKISEIDFYPELLIEKQANEMIYGYVQELKTRKLTLNDYLKARNLTIEQFQSDIIKEVKKSFFIQNILSNIGEIEKVVVTDEHINNFFLTQAQKEMASVEQIKKKTDIEKVKSLILNSLIVDKIVELNSKK